MAVCARRGRRRSSAAPCPVRVRAASTFGGARHRRPGSKTMRRVAAALGRQVHHQHASRRASYRFGVLPAEAAPGWCCRVELPPDLRHRPTGRIDPAGSRPASARRTRGRCDGRVGGWHQRLAADQNSSGMTHHGPIRSARSRSPAAIAALLRPNLEIVRLMIVWPSRWKCLRRVGVQKIEQPMINATSRKRNCSWVRYHSRSQCVCETT